MATVNNSLTKQEEKKTSFSNFLTNEFVKKKIYETVGSIDAQKFMTNILSAVTNNSTLQECNQMSILNCAFLGQSLNLTPSPQLGQYYMVPFNDKNTGGKVAQFILGYKGYVQLAIRSGYYKDIGVFDVKEGEFKGRDKFTGKYKFEFIEDDDIRDEKETIGYGAYFEYLNGFTKSIYWSKEKMLNHADKYSQAFSRYATKGKYPKVSYEDYKKGNYNKKDEWLYSSFWYKSFDEMAYKTMLRQLISKWGIMSTEMQEAYAKDMAEIKDNGDYKYIDNPTETFENDVKSIEQPEDKNIPVQEENVSEKQIQTNNDIINDFFN